MVTKNDLVDYFRDISPEAKPESIDALSDEILRRFADKINNQQDMPPEFAKIINDHFWELTVGK